MATAKDKPKEEVVYTQPTSQLDLEARLADDYVPPAAVATYGTFDPRGEEEYVGVDPIYQNHANDTEAPLAAEEGVLKVAEEAFAESFEGAGTDTETEFKERLERVRSAKTSPEPAHSVTIGERVKPSESKEGPPPPPSPPSTPKK